MRPFLPLTLAFGLLAGCGATDELAVAAGAAGAVVGGCSLLDTDNDDAVTSDEAASGLFNAYDTDDDGVLARGEFTSGVARGRVTAAWDGEFDDWDDDDDDLLTRAEFVDGASDSGGFDDAADATCDDLGL
jgi:hypothetical protein